MFGGRAVLLAVLLVGLAACGTGTQPFSKSSGGASGSGKTPPPVTLVELKNMPTDKRQPLTDLLVEAAAGHDVAIVQGAFGDGLRLDGAFTLEATAGGATLGYEWKLADPTGKLLQSFSGVEVEPGAKAAGWAGISDKLLQQVATSTAQALAAKLAGMGYAVRAASLAPPSGKLAAGPEAATEIDYETLFGPRLSAAPSASPITTASLASVPSSSPLPRPEPKPSPDDPAAIKAIALVSVTGSPGKGDAEIRDALRSTLVDAGWPVVARPERGALTIRGKITVAPPKGETQRVALAWSVSTADGKALGTVRQANDVAAGTLDEGWGPMAAPVARAAAEGLFDLVDGLR